MVKIKNVNARTVAVLTQDPSSEIIYVFAESRVDAKSIIQEQFPELDISKWDEYLQDPSDNLNLDNLNGWHWENGLPFATTVVVVTPEHSGISAIMWYRFACDLDPDFADAVGELEDLFA